MIDDLIAKCEAQLNTRDFSMREAYRNTPCFHKWLKSLPRPACLKQRAIWMMAEDMPFYCATYFQVTYVASEYGLDKGAAEELWLKFCRSMGHAVLTNMDRVIVPISTLHHIESSECGGTLEPGTTCFREPLELIQKLNPRAGEFSPWGALLGKHNRK